MEDVPRDFFPIAGKSTPRHDRNQSVIAHGWWWYSLRVEKKRAKLPRRREEPATRPRWAGGLGAERTMGGGGGGGACRQSSRRPHGRAPWQRGHGRCRLCCVPKVNEESRGAGARRDWERVGWEWELGRADGDGHGRRRPRNEPERGPTRDSDGRGLGVSASEEGWRDGWRLAQVPPAPAPSVTHGGLLLARSRDERAAAVPAAPSRPRPGFPVGLFAPSPTTATRELSQRRAAACAREWRKASGPRADACKRDGSRARHCRACR